jgi:hypothetical protein
MVLMLTSWYLIGMAFHKTYGLEVGKHEIKPTI